MWVCVNMLRRAGCTLPIQNWHLGPAEMTEEMKAMMAPLGVVCVDAYEVRKQHPARILNGWEAKPFAILHCPFKEVLLLDADNVVVVNPEFLFSTQQFKDTGAIFWPDLFNLAPTRSIWEICGVRYQDEPEFESGQMLIDKEKSWRAMNLTMWYNEHSDLYYKHVHGDKETYHMAWRKLGQKYSMPAKRIFRIPDTLCQHDFDGRRIFQHRGGDKWSIHHKNRVIPGFVYEKECFDYLANLRTRMRKQMGNLVAKPEAVRLAAEKLAGRTFLYRRVGYDERELQLLPDGGVGTGSARCETYWDVDIEDGVVCLDLCSNVNVTCRLKDSPDGVWKGQWLRHEKMPIELIPLS